MKPHAAAVRLSGQPGLRRGGPHRSLARRAWSERDPNPGRSQHRAGWAELLIYNFNHIFIFLYIIPSECDPRTQVRKAHIHLQRLSVDGIHLLCVCLWMSHTCTVYVYLCDTHVQRVSVCDDQRRPHNGNLLTPHAQVSL